MENKVLRFHEDGHFRILEVSDFHAGEHFNPKLKKGLELLIEATRPDFIMINGDQCVPFMDFEQARNYFCDIVEPILKRDIPFGTTFGNHDREAGMPLEDQEKVYESIPGCVSEAGPEDIHGIGNYCVSVLSSKDDIPAYNIWAMDSNHSMYDYASMFGLPIELKKKNIVLPAHFNENGNEATVLFNQVQWYYNKSVQMEKDYGKKIPGVVFMHVPLPEFVHICQNPEECNAVGNKRETTGCTEISSGMFLASLERGDIRGYFYGHEHLIDLQGEYCGIIQACDSALGYNMSCHDDMRGGRIIDLYENGEINTRMLHLMDLIGQDAMRDPDYFEGGCKYFIRQLP